MRMTSSLLRLTVIALPIALGACANAWDEFRALTGEDVWTAEELATSPYERGKQHFAAGRYGLAVKHFETALSEDPDSIEIMNGLAAAFDKLGRFELADRFYEKALAFDPKSAQTLNNLGYSNLMRQHYDLALTYLREAQALDPENAMVAFNLQQARAGLDLGEEDFAAAPFGEEDIAQLSQLSRTSRLSTGGAGGGAEESLLSAGSVLDRVHISALASRGDDIWIERTSPTVQTLVTKPQPGLLRIARNAGLAPRLVNYRHVLAPPRRGPSTPWRTPRAARPQASAAPVLQAENAADRHLLGAPEEVVKEEEIVKEMAVQLESAKGAAVGAGAERVVVTAPATDPATDSTMASEVRIAVLESADKAAVASQREAPAAPPVGDEMPVIEVSNGTGRLEMALRISGFLEDQGVATARLTNAEHFRHQETTVFYRTGWRDAAARLAERLPAETELTEAPDQASDIRIELGGDLLDFDRELFYAGTRPSSESSS